MVDRLHCINPEAVIQGLDLSSDGGCEQVRMAGANLSVVLRVMLNLPPASLGQAGADGVEPSQKKAPQRLPLARRGFAVAAANTSSAGKRRSATTCKASTPCAGLVECVWAARRTDSTTFRIIRCPI